jgi:hypothetical protein
MSSKPSFFSKFSNPFTKKTKRKITTPYLRPIDDVMYERLEAKKEKRKETERKWMNEVKMKKQEEELNKRLSELKGPSITMSELEERITKLKKGGTRKNKRGTRKNKRGTKKNKRSTTRRK